ncbi:MAG: response regulator [Verrucomicrobiota bacterium]|nr:response regulator [Verrucomicrobiota bacterium]
MNKKKILIVDDDVALSKLVKITLDETQRYETKIENHSSRALACTREFEPHLILLDVDMPGLDGGDVSRQIRSNASLRYTPILFFTSLVSQSEAGHGMVSRGGENFLAKPIDPTVLAQTIDNLLTKERITP